MIIDTNKLIINADLSQKPVTQVKNITVLNAEVFKHGMHKNYSDILIGLDTDLYLDMLIDIRDDKSEEELKFYFATTINSNYNKVVKGSNTGIDHLLFNDGMLCTLDKDFNHNIIRENYYE